MLYHMLKPKDKDSDSGNFKLPVKVIEAVLKFQGLQKAKNISMIQLDGMCPDDKLL